MTTVSNEDTTNSQTKLVSDKRSHTENIDSLETKLPKKYKQKEYIQNKRQFILTSRFNNQTWNENCDFKKRFSKFACIYCSPVTISLQVPIDSIMFILEMNNDKNKIMGIGMVRNHPLNKRLSVYENDNYNRYQYCGKYHIDRTEMNEEEETIMRVFDILCFRGNRHQKRGHGLTTFPFEMLFRCAPILDLVDFINAMFKRRLFPTNDTKLSLEN